MLHLIKYRLISILREKTVLFWSVFFSFILGTLFFMAFGELSSSIGTIEAAVVVRDESAESLAFRNILGMIGDAEDSPIAVKEMSEKEAEKKLKKDDISGIYYAGKEAELVVSENGVEQSVLQVVLEQFQSRINFITDIWTEKPEQLMTIGNSIMENANATYVEETSLGGKAPDGFVQYYFALIAMTCLFGAYMGMDVACRLQANVSVVGARRTVAATSKTKLLFCDMLTICVVEFVLNIFLLCYLKYVLHISIGDDWSKMLLVVLVGGLVGVSVGICVGSMSRLSESVKVGVLTLVGLLSSFLSGLMVGGIKGLLEEHCPIINRINPASLITDAFYSISMFPDNARYVQDVLFLAVWAAVLFTVALIKMRRVRYDSI